MKYSASTEFITILRMNHKTERFYGRLISAYIYSDKKRDKGFHFSSSDLNGQFCAHDGDLLVFQQKHRFNLYRFSEKDMSFSGVQLGVKDFSFYRYGIVYKAFDDKWYYRKKGYGYPIFLGTNQIACNVFAEKLDDERFQVRFFAKDDAVERVWKSYETARVMGHEGRFIFGVREDGKSDVLTPVGRLYKPRKHCFLKASEMRFQYKTAQVALYGWDEKAEAFSRLYIGDDDTPWMNTIGCSKSFAPYILSIYDDKNQERKLAVSAYVEYVPDDYLKVGKKVFKITHSRMLEV